MVIIPVITLFAISFWEKLEIPHFLSFCCVGEQNRELWLCLFPSHTFSRDTMELLLGKDLDEHCLTARSDCVLNKHYLKSASRTVSVSSHHGERPTASQQTCLYMSSSNLEKAFSFLQRGLWILNLFSGVCCRLDFWEVGTIEPSA